MTQRRPPTPHATRPRGAGSGAPGQSQGQAAVGQEQGCKAVHRLHATRQRRFPPVAAWASSRSGLSKLLSPHPQVICTVSSDLLPGFLSKPQAPPPRVPHRPARVSGLGARAVAQTLCVAVALSCLPQAAQCPLLQAPEAPSCPSRSVCW